MKHTKGPWNIEGESTLNIVSRAAAKGRRISSLLATCEEDNANARLIAAAPEMLEALESVLKNNRLMNALEVSQRRLIMDAVSKATGDK